MEFPLWFQSAIQRRIDDVSARIGRYPELRKLRIEGKEAFNTVFNGIDKTKLTEYMEWEDKHNYSRALENERLYLQGMRDGAQLVFALMTDFVAADKEVLSVLSKTKTIPVNVGNGRRGK